MRYLYRRGRGSRHRVMHLTFHDAVTGQPTMVPLCSTPGQFDTTINVPFGLGRPVCKQCKKFVPA